ncbi:DNA-packaging protein [Desulfohalobium retbaense]|uniref:Uncharacterized protein n=1 Tax=Desulfohalobium retbaense (strain ATCC 49708 / DSM 5692 / JCM 16813 / HR100) TaxID=485915 RepID=C8X3A0_DESRD|nr:DNA-packaging protein [Desulfohalobium retbaense]ACV68897.1 hypothetical protein Dret_1613 [Desulfohalobium retbaense DSM 5692]
MSTSPDTPRNVGRPPSFESPEEMATSIDEYFLRCDAENRPYTVPGLARALGFSTRKSLWDYEGKPEFVNTIKRAKLRIEEQRSEQLIMRQSNCTGLIFDLKNNFGWQDKFDQEVTARVSNSIEERTLACMPPEPKDMNEWRQWYNEQMAHRPGGQEQTPTEPEKGLE